jgi:N-acetylneuraminic acid mutarotase
VEVVDLSSSSSSCNQLPNYPLKIQRSFGGFFNNTTPIICGGTTDGVEIFNKCHILNQNSWITAQSMSVPRCGASLTKYPSAMATSENDLLVIGGENSSPGYLSSLEVYGPSGWSLINSQLPEGLFVLCAITVNDTHVLITGGLSDSQPNGASGTIWFDAVNEKFSPGPTMNSARSYHGCGKIKSIDTFDDFIIVVGGYNGSSHLDSTEILEPGSNEWKMGPKLPSQITGTTIVEDQVSNSLLLVGGGYDDAQSHKILRLATATSQWEEVEQELVVARRGSPVAFFIPDSFADCHEEEQGQL